MPDLRITELPALPLPALTDLIPIVDLTGPTTKRSTIGQLRGVLLPVDLTADVSGILPPANGGTGLASGTSGGVLAYTAAGILASSAALAANQLVLGGGAGVVPATLGSLGTTTTVLHGNAAGAPTFGAVSLSTDVSGDLPFANLAQGSALSVLGVTGNATADVASIAAGTDNQVLRRSGTALAFGAVNLASSDAVTGALPIANGGTNATSFTSTRIPFFDGTRFVDDADLTFAVDTLSATKLLAPTSVSTPQLLSTTTLTLAPAAGLNLNIALSTTGDFAVNTNHLYVDTSTGYVGIKTTTPAGRFHVVDDQAVPAMIFEQTNTSGYGVVIRAGGTATGRYGLIIRNAADTVDYFRILSETGKEGETFILGNVGIGTKVLPTTGTAGLVFSDGTALSGMGANTAGLYANDVAGTVEMFAIGEDGVATQISPHGFPLLGGPSEELAWAHYAKHPNGKEINVDMLAVVRAVERLTSEQFVVIR